jgi:hypothetical protein
MGREYDPFYSDRELKKRWKVTDQTLWRWRTDGKLKSTKFPPGGKRNRTSGDEVRRIEQGDD